MAPAELSPPGTATYASDRLNVGDGTWDYEKNTFLLPPLVPLNFDMMQYNGMGNRFSTMPQYHTLVMGHGILATMTFLFLIPAAVMTARFYTTRPGYAVRYHTYLNVVAVGLATVSFILGWFAVGPNRSLTNPHHGIGVAIYTLLMLQAIGGRFIRNIRKVRSFRITIHQWNGRAVALLGIVQVPLGLTLYGSPKYTFILYAVWVGLLVLLYFVLSYRHAGQREEYYSGARSEAGRSRVTRTDITETDYTENTERTDRTGRGDSGGGGLKWLGPLAAGAGAMAFWKRKKRERSMSRNRSRSRSRMRSHSGGPSEVVASRRGSPPSTYLDYDEEKRSSRANNKNPSKKEEEKGGGFMKKMAGLTAMFGAGALGAKFAKKKDDTRDRRDETAYSAVSTETPSRYDDRRRGSRRGGGTVVSDYTDATTDVTARPRSPLLPGPGGNHPATAAATMSAAAGRPGASNGRPVTPPQSHRRNYSRPEADSLVYSDYSSFRDDSPSRRSAPPRRKSGGVTTADAAGGGIMAGLGLGWLASKFKGKGKEEERPKYDDEESRVGDRSRRYTNDDSPSRRNSRRAPAKPAPSALSEVTSMTESSVEPRPTTGYGAAPGGSRNGQPTMTPATGGPRRSMSRSRREGPYASGHESADDAYQSASGGPGRRSSRRRRESEAAAADAVASASRLASHEARRYGGGSQASTSIKVKVDPDRHNVTLRRIPPGEAAQAASSRSRRQRTDSISSNSVSELSPNSRQTYRRDSSMRRAEEAAERAVDVNNPSAPLPTPNPRFAGGRSRPAPGPSGQDGGYYGDNPPPPPGPPPPAYGARQPPVQAPGGPPPPPPPGGMPPGPPRTPVGLLSVGGQTVTSLHSHGTWSGMSPSSIGPPESQAEPVAPSESAAADRRRRRREERSGARPSDTSTVDFN
ncbi:hypothetical protein RB594_003108 [Gaeumannomyces avenae]